MSFSAFRRFRFALPACCACLLAGRAGAADTATWTDPVDLPAEVMPLASQGLLLDVVSSAGHYVAVGARGVVLLSDDGKQWRQADVPTRTTFTAVDGIDANLWAVGHAGVIAHSTDGGEHWQIQRKDPWHRPDPNASAPPDPRQGAPLLDVLFENARHGFAVGAYSLALRTDDGGTTWTPMSMKAPVAKTDAATTGSDSKSKGGEKDKGANKGSWGVLNENEMDLGEEPNPHLNAIARTGSGALFIVGERGSAFRSRDDGATWQRLKMPYDGSMFGVLGYPGDHVIAFGLRGHVYESTDLGDHWTQLSTDTELSLMGGAKLPDDGAVIVGANGIVLVRHKAGAPLTSYVDQPAGIIAEVLPTGDDSLLVAGENGISTYHPH